MSIDDYQKLTDVLQAFRSLKPDITVNHVVTFLAIASSEEGVTTEDIQELLNTTQASASRNLRLFDYMDTKDVKGLGLADTMMSRTTPNTKVRILSPDGKKFLRKIEDILKS